jgi:YVTN family beta-propeller protein
VSTFIAFVALMSSVLTIGFQSVAGADTPTGTIMTGTNPLDITLNSAGTVAYVANFGDNSVSVITLSTNTVVTIPLPTGSTGPSRIALNPAGTLAYVSNSNSDNISVITLSSNTVTATIALPTGSFPEQIAVTSTDAYVADRGTNSISVIQLSDNSLQLPLTPGVGPEGIVLNSTHAYVTNRTAGTVSVINLSTNTGTVTIPVGTAPTRIAMNSADTEVFVTNSGSGTVSVINLSTNTVVATITVATTPDAVVVDPLGNYALVSNSGSGTVSVIQVSTNTVVGLPIVVGATPEGIVVNPAGTFAYVTNFGSNNGSVISLANTVTFNANGGTLSMTPEVSNVPAALTVNGFTRATYTFNGWNTAANGSGTAYANNASYPFITSTTLYAQWGLTGVTDSYSYVAGTGGSGTAPTPGTGADGTTITLAANTFANSGHTFAGWSDGTTTYAAGSTYILAGGTAKVFTAQWTLNSVGCGSCGGGVAPTLNSLTISASSVNVTVGGTIHPTASVTSGLAAGDTATMGTVTLTYAGTGTTVYAASTTAPSAVGTYSVTPSVATVSISPSTDAANYSTTYSYVAGKIVINPVVVVIVVTPPVPHASRIVGSVVVGASRHVTIVGTGFAKGSHVRSTEKGAVVRVISVSANRIVISVTVRKGQRPGRNVFIITAASGKPLRIAYVTK